MRSNKKAGLEISINAIVILILAITVLGIGLAFINGMFQDTFNKLDKVSESIDKQMREQMEDTPGRVILQNDNIDIRKKDKEIKTYFAIRNEMGDDHLYPFDVEFVCTSSFEDESDLQISIEDSITFKYLKEVTVEKDDIRVLPVEIKIDPNAAITTYECSLLIDEGEYDSKDIFITITR